MKRCLICLALMMSPLLSIAQNYLPRDVQRFVDRREGCDEIRRLKESSSNMPKACAGTDKELVQLKRKYAINSTITQILNQFDAGIDAVEEPAPKSSAVIRAR